MSRFDHLGLFLFILLFISTPRTIYTWSLQPGQIVRTIYRIEQFYQKYSFILKELDLSAGSVYLSSRHIQSLDFSNESIETEIINKDYSLDEPPPPAVLYLQLGRRAIKKVPNGVLLGAIVLASTELLQRGVNVNSAILPPVVRDIANSTLEELDQKLELLSKLEWRVDPFLQSEILTLKSQPFDALEKYLSNDVLPWVDTEGSVLLSGVIKNPSQRKAAIKNIQELIKLSVDTLLFNPSNPQAKSGKEWNRIFTQLGNIFLSNIRAQPIEAIDKFVLNDVLPQIDKEISPVLDKLLADPTQVQVITNNIKDLIRVTSSALVTTKNTNPSIQPIKDTTKSISDSLITQIDKISSMTEYYITEWNRIVQDVNKGIKIESVTDMAPNKVYSMWLKTRAESAQKKEVYESIIKNVNYGHNHLNWSESTMISIEPKSDSVLIFDFGREIPLDEIIDPFDKLNYYNYGHLLVPRHKIRKK